MFINQPLCIEEQLLILIVPARIPVPTPVDGGIECLHPDQEHLLEIYAPIQGLLNNGVYLLILLQTRCLLVLATPLLLVNEELH